MRGSLLVLCMHADGRWGAAVLGALNCECGGSVRAACMLPLAQAHPLAPSALASLLPFHARPQIMRIVQNIRPDRQTVMFSATFPRQVGLCQPLPLLCGGWRLCWQH